MSGAADAAVGWLAMVVELVSLQLCCMICVCV
jgi:hypothetical protein